MTNVFTRKSKYPRVTTLADYNGHEAKEVAKLPRLPSATRVGNPHPAGLTYQALTSDVKVSIWNPNFYKYDQRVPNMMEHLDRVNFSCGKLTYAPRRLGKMPNIKYTESTVSRVSYRNPYLLPALDSKMKSTRYGYTPISQQARGIVPDLSPPRYRIIEPAI
ncbi:hypothetical protein LOTGIDRAFT_237300 [Lottia gigantea]|uniref:Uncharacterized protein n=1 Tax=Lottia gigantea TaxID=225164 RepID=V4B2Z2_LOTGI|nr:hypothetical protein LOTGIDRAFT_237300 [Lottia gigantea]ESP04543.1 hypothetical protein LOTGIDRAFT_237300 [Lottia gigantea]